MPEEVKELIKDYEEGKITRREFIQKAALFTGSLAVAASLTDAVIPAVSRANMVDPDDPELASEEVKYKGKAGDVSAYLSRPKASGKYPAIIVIHENRGINDHIRDVARRLAKKGYVALAPDYLSRKGGTMKVNPEGKGIRGLREMISAQDVSEDTESGYQYLRSLPRVQSGKMGVVGFCWGGEMAFAVATQVSGLDAVVVYYGRSPKPLELVKNIEAPVLAHYGGEDKRVNAGIPDTEAAMKKYNKTFTYKIYPGAKHAFNSDTRPDRYHPEAAKEAWAKTLEFFKKELKG